MFSITYRSPTPPVVKVGLRDLSEVQQSVAPTALAYLLARSKVAHCINEQSEARYDQNTDQARK
jgi:hypothetical protein